MEHFFLGTRDEFVCDSLGVNGSSTGPGHANVSVRAVSILDDTLFANANDLQTVRLSNFRCGRKSVRRVSQLVAVLHFSGYCDVRSFFRDDLLLFGDGTRGQLVGFVHFVRREKVDGL